MGNENRERVKVITICGSSKFVEVMAVVAWLLEKEENAITMDLHLLPYWYDGGFGMCEDHLAEHEGVADQMDALHFKKIELSDEIFVIDINGYIGESTSKEIEHAISLGKKVRKYSDPDEDIPMLVNLMIKKSVATQQRELEKEKENL